jgi:uncharacterized protein (DUF427 family)
MRREGSSSKLWLVADLNSWYFKEAALIDRGKFSASETTSHCGWKGMSALEIAAWTPKITLWRNNV